MKKIFHFQIRVRSVFKVVAARDRRNKCALRASAAGAGVLRAACHASLRTRRSCRRVRRKTSENPHAHRGRGHRQTHGGRQGCSETSCVGIRVLCEKFAECAQSLPAMRKLRFVEIYCYTEISFRRNLLPPKFCSVEIYCYTEISFRRNYGPDTKLNSFWL
jgi:hypothetical protein